MPERAYPKCNVYKNADFRYNFAVPVSNFPKLEHRENRYFHENRPYRLAARTQGSHPCNSGSIPDGVTNQKFKAKLISFFFSSKISQAKSVRFPKG